MTTTTNSLLTTKRFGPVEYSAQDVVTFPDGIIGFPKCNSFLLFQHKEGSAFRWLQSIDQPELAFLVVEAVQFVQEYEFQIGQSVVATIELTEESPYLVYTVVTIPKGNPEGMTLNLAGPIVINAANQKAKQLVLEDPRWPLRYAVVPQDSAQAKAA